MATSTAQLSMRSPFNIPPSVASAHPAPAGAFLPGTKVQVGSHRVIIEKYLSEGGYAHVYVVRLPKPIDGNDLAVLKRVAVPDKEELASMRTEVDTMKRLRGQNYIVKYIDSHASQLKGSGYEVFLLMEYCAGGGLIDFMNTRLQQRLTEPEILRIFTDVARGVASMHYLKPPLLHRDIKVENVLISGSGSSKKFKVCDFGSTAPPRPAATTAAEARIIEDDIQRHTTLQYRSPEMIDVYRKHAIDEKSDIWALGVFLYKLCYYTTPFEELGQMAILNAKFKYPAYPQFSDQLKLLIANMLREDPAKRPNIYQVISQVCQIQGKDPQIADIYAKRSQSDVRKSQQLPDPSSSQSRAGAIFSPPAKAQPTSVPEIAPMRRGRPDKPVSHHNSAKPSPSPLRMIDGNDAFATLDSGKAQAIEDFSARYPALDEFSLLTDSGHKFDFAAATTKDKGVKTQDLSTRITNALADDAFVRSPSPPKSRSMADLTVPAKGKPNVSVRDAPNDIRAKPNDLNSRFQTLGGPKSSAPSAVSSAAAATTTTQASSQSLQRYPSADGTGRSSSVPKAYDNNRASNPGTSSGSRLANLLKEDASHSQLAFLNEPRSPTSSRPSLEGGRPSLKDLDADLGLSRSRSLDLRQRPASVNIGKRPTHVNDRKINKVQYSSSAEKNRSIVDSVDCDTNITSDMDFLRAKEEEEKNRHRHHKRLSSGSRHFKRTSLPSIAVVGTKNLLTGRFGDVFRKFEHNDNSHSGEPRTPSPSREPINALTPIAGSEATDLSDDRLVLEETEDLSPEMRRELEKRRLDAEERRVEAAAAEYRIRVAQRGGSGSGNSKIGAGPAGGVRAATIQNSVQSLLKENDKPVSRTAESYGRFTNTNSAASMSLRQYQGNSNITSNPPAKVPSLQHAATEPAPVHETIPSAETPRSFIPPPQAQHPSSRPLAPPKPQILRTGGRTPNNTASKLSNSPLSSSSPVTYSDQATTSSTTASAPHILPASEPLSPTGGAGGEDWETNFNKRYPRLSGLDMVETEIGSASGAGSNGKSKDLAAVRVREV